MNHEVDFDERFFINHNGLQHTPIKLVSPMNNYSNGSAVALQQNSSTVGQKSPIGKSALSALADQNYQANKRPRGDSVPLKFVTPEEISQR